MPVSSTSSDYDHHAYQTSKSHQPREPSPTKAHMPAQASDNRSSHRQPQAAQDDRGHTDESRSRTSQGNRDAEERTTMAPHPPAKEKDTRLQPSTRGAEESRLKETDESSRSRRTSSQDGFEYVDASEIPFNEKEQTKAHSNSRSTSKNYALAVATGTGKQSSQPLPSEQQSSSASTHAQQGATTDLTKYPPQYNPSDPTAMAAAQVAGGPPGLPPKSHPGPEHVQHGQQGGPEAREGQATSSYLSRFAVGPFASQPRDKWKEEFQRAASDAQRLQEELKKARSHIYTLRHNCQELDNERLRYKDHSITLKHELASVQRELEEYKTLSEIRGKELVGAQVFLTKADLLSISELVQKVNALNDENFQAAASFGDILVHRNHEWPKEQLEACYRGACEILGEPIAKILADNADKPDINPLLVQVVLQITLVRFCALEIERWYQGSQETNDFLTTIYGEIRRTEEQAVSGRWRAITHSHTRPSSDNWKSEFMSKLRSIAKIAAWDIVSTEKREAYEQKLEPIFKAVKDLRVALGEQFTSADIEISIVFAKTRFHPEWMEDAYGDSRQNDGKQKEEVVIGTTGIGLKKMVSRGSSDSEQYQSVLSPKIILESTLQEALDPSPQPRKRARATRG
ncbi:hypothetical protein BDZ97DRAFT_1923060 [Flammula alnicola]|nr:hypothetical protein BDZ97DRAFT_1923060 [Flammula alnicola]